MFAKTCIKDGFGNLKAGCGQCGCHLTGSRSDVCDPDSGQCECLPGVTGLSCNMCKPNHYGFSNQGCQGNFILMKINDVIGFE